MIKGCRGGDPEINVSSIGTSHPLWGCGNEHCHERSARSTGFLVRTTSARGGTFTSWSERVVDRSLPFSRTSTETLPVPSGNYQMERHCDSHSMETLKPD